MDEGEPAGPADAVSDWYDAETGLLGRRSWARVLEVETARCKRYGRLATVVVAEVTGLEDVAAVWGSDVGGQAVARVGARLRAGARSSDYLARIEPRRFAILLPETDEVAAVNFVERVRATCDTALHSADPRARCRFGWADAKKSRPLDVAADIAVARLASDNEVGQAG